jgi:hypothetical protein
MCMSEQLEPQHVADAYTCFTKHAVDWRFDHLTQRHWDEMILGSLKTGSIQHILDEHPFVNPYCDYARYRSTGRWE